MSNHSEEHIQHPHRARTVQLPSPWSILPTLLGWILVGFVVLFTIMFLLAMLGLS